MPAGRPKAPTRANWSSYGATSYADHRDLVASTSVFDGVVGYTGQLVGASLVGASLFGVSPADPLSFGAATLVLATTAVAAGLGPARRAVGIDPSVLLRAE